MVNFFWPMVFLGIAATHVFFHARFLYDWDAAQFALSLNTFDVLNHRPHPPGYILLVAAGKLLNFFFNDANFSFLTINFISHMLSTILVYSIGRSIFNEKIGRAAAAIFAFSAITVFNSNITCAYGAEGLVALAIAWATLRCIRLGTPESLYQSAMIFGLGGGIRQNLLILLLPLWAFGIFYCHHKFQMRTRTLVMLVGLLGAATLCWLLPLVYLSGGLATYRQATSDLLTYQFGQTSVFYGITSLKFLKISGRLLGWLLIPGLGLSSIALIITAARSRTAICAAKFWKRPEPWFFLLWIAPSFAFYALFHLPKPGYLLTFLGAFCVLAGYACAQVFGERNLWKTATVVCVVLLLQFILPVALRENDAPQMPRGLRQAYQMMFADYSRSAIHDKDTYMQDVAAFILQHGDPKNTALVSENIVESKTPNRRMLRHLMAYFPDFNVYEIARPARSPSVFHTIEGREPGKPFSRHERDGFLTNPDGATASPVKVTMQTHRLIFLPGDLAPSAPTAGWRTFVTPAGNRFSIADVRDQITYGQVTFEALP